MATTTGTEAYEARMKLTHQASQCDNKPTEQPDGRDRGEKYDGGRGELGRRAQQQPPTPPKTPEKNDKWQEGEYQERIVKLLGESLQLTAQTVLRLHPGELTSTTCTMIQDAYRRVPEYIQMVEEYGKRRESYIKILKKRVKELEETNNKPKQGSWAQVAGGQYQQTRGPALHTPTTSSPNITKPINAKKLSNTKMRRVT
ncbi:MAG: hypothetical protein LQ351_008197, partial [Letrouitia transgressa]